MVLLRSLDELVPVISCLKHEESDKMVGKRNSLSGSTVLTEHLSASVAVLYGSRLYTSNLGS